MRVFTRALALTVVVGAASAAALAAKGDYGPWSDAVRVESIPGTHPDFNGPFLDGCPFVSRDGKTFYMARGPEYGGSGGIDIWVSTRAGADDPWGAPVNVGPPVNSPANDFCPTIARDGHEFYFVSNRTANDSAGQPPCGGDDIYNTRLRGDGSWDSVVNLGCDVNTVANEASPFPLPQSTTGPVLYFSSTVSGAGDLYLSEWQGGAFQGRELVPGVNTASVEGQPNVRRDGLELFFFSNRPGSLGNDIYSASRASTADDWSTPVNLGSAVNGMTTSSETRPSLSWDGTTLYFGSTRNPAEGSDHYVTTREKLTGSAG
jgi:ribosomal protein L24E